MAKRHPKSLIAALHKLYPHHGKAETARRLNKQFGANLTAANVKALAKNYGVRLTPEALSRAFRVLTPAQEARLRDLYWRLPLKRCLEIMNDEFGGFTLGRLKNYVANYGIQGAPDKPNVGQLQYHPERGLPFRIKKSEHRGRATEFKPGHSSTRNTPLWHERLCPKAGLLIKVPEKDPYTGRPSRYIRKAIWIWQQANGPVPGGHNVVLIDGDPLNCDLDNLILLSNKELGILNSRTRHTKPDPKTRSTMIALARLDAAITGSVE